MFNDHMKFIALARLAKTVADGPGSWQTKYEIIFSDEVSVAMRKTGVKLDYYDPDMDYEDDVKAFVSAANERADELEKTLSPLDGFREEVLALVAGENVAKIIEEAAHVVNAFDQANTGRYLVETLGRRGEILELCVRDLRRVLNANQKRTILTEEQVRS